MKSITLIASVLSIFGSVLAAPWQDYSNYHDYSSYPAGYQSKAYGQLQFICSNFVCNKKKEKKMHFKNE